MSVEPRMCPITYRTHLYKGCPLQSLCYTVIRDRIYVGSCVRGETELRESNGTESERIALEERTCYNGVVQHIILLFKLLYLRGARRVLAPRSMYVRPQPPDLAPLRLCMYNTFVSTFSGNSLWLLCVFCRIV